MVEVVKSKYLNKYLEYENIWAIDQKAIVWCFVKREYFFGPPGSVLK